MEKKTLYMIGNAHIDPVWLWQWQEGFHEVKATFRSALDLMDAYPEFVFTASSAAFYEWVEHSDPAMFAEIRQRVAEGRWGLVGGWWIEPDCNIPSGESFVRQGLYGQRYFMEKFGLIARVGYAVDSFGHNGMLPQILKKSGLDYYVFMRPMPHEKELPARLFWWEADDGSRVLACRLPFTYGTWGEDDLVDHVRQCADEIQPPLHEGLCFYGVGDHGGGPTRANLDGIRRLAEQPDQPALVCASPEAFFGSVQAQSETLPVVHDDLQHHASGCYAAHSGIKRWNRQAENSLLVAEKFSAIANVVTGQPYPENFALAWKTVLFNQFHDIMAGTSLEIAYEDARSQIGQALAIADRSLTFAVQSIAGNIHIPKDERMRPVVAFNPHPWAVRCPVELEYGYLPDEAALLDESGQPLPMQALRSSSTTEWRRRLGFVADLPPLGYRLFQVIQSAAQPPFPSVQCGDHFLDNGRLRLEIDPQSGCIARLLDKRSGVDVFAGPGARPVVVDDPSDSWSHGVFRFDQEIATFTATSVRLVESGPVKALIRVISTYGSSQLVQELSLYARLDRIDVSVQVDWREQHKLLKLRFPVNVDQAVVVNEIPYGHIQRKADGDEEPMQGWVDVSGLSPQTGAPYGLSLLNDGKYSFDARQNDLGLTILRSPIYAHHEPAVPQPGEFYAYLDQGIQRFHYSLVPHPGSWTNAGVPRRSAELNQPAVALAATYHPQGILPAVNSFLHVEPENILVSALKQAETGHDLILRLYETHRQAVRAVIRLPFLSREFAADFGPCEIKTFRIPRDPSLPVREVNLLEWGE